EGHAMRAVPDEVPEVPLPSSKSNVVPLKENEHHNRHCQRLVEVGIGRMQVLDQGDGQKVEPVGDEDVEADRRSKWYYKARRVRCVFHGVAPHVAEQPLDDGLEPAWIRAGQPTGDEDRRAKRNEDRKTTRDD